LAQDLLLQKMFRPMKSGWEIQQDSIQKKKAPTN